jgi:hypothetical protein
MLAVLAASLGLGAIVVHLRIASLKVALDRPRAIDGAGLMAALPQGWILSNDGPEAIAADEPQGQRRLLLSRRRVSGLVSPLDYLRRSGAMPTDARPVLRSARIGPWPALLTQWSSRIASGELAGQTSRGVAIVAALPSGDIVAVRLHGVGRAEASDGDLVQRVAESIELGGVLPPAPAQAEFDLGHGIRAAVPEGFVTSPSDDPYRAGLRLVAQESPGSLSLELVGCFFPPGEGAQTLAAMVACRDPSAPVGAIAQGSPNTWICRRSDESGTWAAMTFVLVHGDGQALLAEMRADSPDLGQMESVWRSIAASARFAPQTDLAARLAAGQRLAQRLAADPNLVLGQLATPERWLWYDQSPASRARWTLVNWTLGGQWIQASRSTQIVGLDGSRATFERRFLLSRDLGYYKSVAANEAGNQTHEVRAEFGRVTLHAGDPQAAARQWSGPAPNQYVPGALLPYALSVAGDEPMVLRTESLFIADGVAAPGLLTLLVEARDDLPRRDERSGQPMRCLGVSISGTGEVSRWYFGAGGELAYVDLSGGVRLQRERASP